MKNILVIAALLVTMVSCGHKANKTSETATVEQAVNIANNATAVIYFHSNHRCSTCLAVEDVAKKAAAKENIPFYLIDVTKDINKAVMEQFDISTQSLLIIKDGKRKDVTSGAFMYARSKPEKIIADIQSEIVKL